ncbi:MAG: helix-turn-helix domain-containing protein [Blastocatellia bacterium]
MNSQSRSSQTKLVNSLEQLLNQSLCLADFLKLISDRRIKKAITLLHEEPAQEWCYQSLGKHLNLSPDRIRHLFVAETGIGLPHYQREIKLYHAKQMLDTTELNLKEIAAQVGMSNELALRRAFKGKFGICPSYYRDDVAQTVVT